ncbi:MAG: DEAD/DEAH box helicase [Verrucomicrobia bacterium]|nr:DEAD/DEAH box helicase [Verrucomicrobiota bacterium]
MPFNVLGLDPNILKAVQESGYTEPTPIQSAAIPQILDGHDLIGIAQTGTGKTAAFTLPILTRLAAAQSDAPRARTKVLVLAPTRELALQIDENIRGYGHYLPFRAGTVFGGVGESTQIRALRDGFEIIIACPGRLLDLMGRKYADFSSLEFLVLDEADRMLDMGFIPSIRRIVRMLPQKRQTLLFSATLSKEIEAITKEFLRTPKIVQIGRRSNPADTVTQRVHETTKEGKQALLAKLLREPEMNMVLVFVRMKHAADRVARQLERSGVRCATLHSNRSQGQRLKALKDFKSGAVQVLVATDIAARGIDVDGISHVINYDFPMHPEDYVHRIGRTGRAQSIGDAISFVTREDYGALRALERFIGRGIVRAHSEGGSTASHPQRSVEAASAPAVQSSNPPSRTPQSAPDFGSPVSRGDQRSRSRDASRNWREPGSKASGAHPHNPHWKKQSPRPQWGGQGSPESSQRRREDRYPRRPEGSFRSQQEGAPTFPRRSNGQNSPRPWHKPGGGAFRPPGNSTKPGYQGQESGWRRDDNRPRSSGGRPYRGEGRGGRSQSQPSPGRSGFKPRPGFTNRPPQ